MNTPEVDALDVVYDFEAKKPKNIRDIVSSHVNFSLSNKRKTNSSPKSLVKEL